MFEYFHCINKKEITHSPQFWSGSFFIKKNDNAERFVKKWNKVFEERFDLIDDTPSNIKNFSGFIENRHDQSIWTLLCLKHQIKIISAYELWYPKKNSKKLVMI